MRFGKHQISRRRMVEGVFWASLFLLVYMWKQTNSAKAKGSDDDDEYIKITKRRSPSNSGNKQPNTPPKGAVPAKLKAPKIKKVKPPKATAVTFYTEEPTDAPILAPPSPFQFNLETAQIEKYMRRARFPFNIPGSFLEGEQLLTFEAIAPGNHIRPNPRFMDSNDQIYFLDYFCGVGVLRFANMVDDVVTKQNIPIDWSAFHRVVQAYKRFFEDTRNVFEKGFRKFTRMVKNLPAEMQIPGTPTDFGVWSFFEPMLTCFEMQRTSITFQNGIFLCNPNDLQSKPITWLVDLTLTKRIGWYESFKRWFYPGEHKKGDDDDMKEIKHEHRVIQCTWNQCDVQGIGLATQTDVISILRIDIDGHEYLTIPAWMKDIEMNPKIATHIQQVNIV
eukprot:PhF_6_TR6917/c0_g1_i3/m.10079